MKLVVAVVLVCVAAVAVGATDPVAGCRAAHAGDPDAHIACLEEALRAAGVAPAGQAAPAADVSASVAAPPAAAPVAAASAAAAGPEAPTGLGAEQAKSRQRPADAPPERAEVRIVSTRYDAADLGTFTMADGQVWRETVASPVRHHLDAGREYAARIERGKVGGYRLYVEGVTWMIKVERLK